MATWRKHLLPGVDGLDSTATEYDTSGPILVCSLIFVFHVVCTHATDSCHGALVRYPVCAALYIKVGSELGCQVTVNEVPPAESDEEPEANPAFTTTAVMET